MATPRKKIKIRDKEATIIRLIEMVGVVLRENGYRWLNPSEIQKRLGRNRRQIYSYFQNMNNLLKTYLRTKDYWLPYFERFSQLEVKDEESIKRLFIQMMQENLDHFFEDPEMQSIVLWQISERRQMLTELGLRRESEGEKLLKLTDAHFKGSGINFRAIVGTILGGTYYLVLHSTVNGSTVSSMDMNRKEDFAAVREAIAQIITWAWDMAGEHHKQKLKSSTIMDHELARLHHLAAGLSSQENQQDQQEYDDLASQFVVEVRRLEWVMLQHIGQLSNETQLKTYVQISFSTLVKICDTLYGHGIDQVHAKLLLNLMETLRAAVPDFIPGSLMIPKLFRDEQGMILSDQWQQISAVLNSYGVKAELLEIAGFPYKRFQQGSMHWVDFRYLKRYTNVLRNLRDRATVSTVDLAETLVGLGFNHARFMAWYAKYIQDEMTEYSYKDLKRMLSRHKAQLRQLVVYTDLLFHPYKLSPTQQLSNWIDAELTYQMENAPNAPFNPSAMQTQLTDLQIIWWQQFQQKHGLYNEPDQSILLRKTLFNYRNLERKEIDELSLRLDPRESNVITPFESILQNMLEEVKNLV